MLDKFLASFKKSPPDSHPKKRGKEDQHVDSEEENEESHDTSDNDNDSKAKKKKQISTIIRVVAILALGYMVVTEFILKEEVIETPVIKPHKRKKKFPPLATATKPGEIAKPGETTKPVEAAKPGEATKPVEATKSEEAIKLPPVENINIAEKTTEKEIAKQEAQKTDEAAVKAEEKAEAKAEEKAEAKAQAKAKAEAKLEKAINEAPIVKETNTAESHGQDLDKMIDNVEKSSDKTADTPANKKDSKMEDKIVADDEYTPPPSYEQLGRGLVYNCKEKYWACLDKPAYIACNKNMKWNSSHGKTSECAVTNVYNSDEDCSVMQKYNISTSVPTTSFCK
jgi:hypothetical protein